MKSSGPFPSNSNMNQEINFYFDVLADDFGDGVND